MGLSAGVTAVVLDTTSSAVPVRAPGIALLDRAQTSRDTEGLPRLLTTNPVAEQAGVSFAADARRATTPYGWVVWAARGASSVCLAGMAPDGGTLQLTCGPRDVANADGVVMSGDTPAGGTDVFALLPDGSGDFRARTPAGSEAVSLTDSVALVRSAGDISTVGFAMPDGRERVVPIDVAAP